jgi:hypothetical protein
MKGKHGNSVNRLLSEELATAQHRLARLEREFHVVTSERDVLQGWKAAAMEGARPAVDAERQRADAAVARIVGEVEAERTRWQTRVNAVTPSLKRLIRSVPENAKVLDENSMAAMADLWGSQIVDWLGGTNNRLARRNTVTAKALHRQISAVSQQEGEQTDKPFERTHVPVAEHRRLNLSSGSTT